MAPQLPLYRHPTLTVLIEGREEAVRQLLLQLDPGLTIKTYETASAALVDIELSVEEVRRAGLPVPVLAGDDVAAASDLEDGLKSIYRYVQGPQRFYAPATVVVACDMSEDAMVACEEVSHLQAKKIWYADEADDARGVEAFNRGLINRYIRSDLAQAPRRLGAEILTLQTDYFVERSRYLGTHALDVDAYRFLSDASFVSLVEDLADRYGFIEHYLFCSPSGLLFFDIDATPTLMVVQTEEGMVRQFERARDFGAPAALLQDLFECRVVPFFRTPDGTYPVMGAEQAADLCRPATVCYGESEYYWALFDLPQSFQLGEPFSHAQFIRAQQGAGY